MRIYKAIAGMIMGPFILYFGINIMIEDNKNEKSFYEENILKEDVILTYYCIPDTNEKYNYETHIITIDSNNYQLDCDYISLMAMSRMEMSNQEIVDTFIFFKPNDKIKFITSIKNPNIITALEKNEEHSFGSFHKKDLGSYFLICFGALLTFLGISFLLLFFRKKNSSKNDDFS